MTPDIEKYYETYFDLFLTEGWKQFIDDVGEACDVFDVRNVSDVEQLKLVQGQLLVLDRILNWEASVTTSYETIKAQEENGE